MRTSDLPMFRNRHTRTLVLAAVLALGLAACGSNDPSTVEPAAAAASGEVSASHNDADIAFITDMTPHHIGALAMAELAPTRAQNDDVKALAARIVAAQDPELDRMQQLAKAWGVTLDRTEGMGGMHGGGTAMGGMSMSDTDALKPLSGAAFDKAFLTAMIGHHQGALPMAQADLDKGENPQAKELATSIIAAQTAEIAEMQDLLGKV